MAIENNPLKQYFRRPSIYLKLPSKGTGYTADVLSMTETGELPVYPMTAIDEISSKTPDSLYNGTAVVDIIKSCVPNIKNPWKISSTDLDAILVAIRIATNGNEMDIETTCPSCNEELKYGINLSFILQNFRPGDYAIPMDVGGDMQFKFRPLNYKELTESGTKQFEIQKTLAMINGMPEGDEREKRSGELLKTITISTLEVLASTIESIQIPDAIVTEKAYIVDFLQNCDKKVFEAIKDRSVSLRETTQLKPLHIKCTACEHEYDQTFTLNVSDFFD